LMSSEKVIFIPLSSFSRKRESSQIKQFWAPAFAGATAFLAFYETIYNRRDIFPLQRAPGIRGGTPLCPAQARGQLNFSRNILFRIFPAAFRGRTSVNTIALGILYLAIFPRQYSMISSGVRATSFLATTTAFTLSPHS